MVFVYDETMATNQTCELLEKLSGEKDDRNYVRDHLPPWSRIPQCSTVANHIYSSQLSANGIEAGLAQVESSDDAMVLNKL